MVLENKYVCVRNYLISSQIWRKSPPPQSLVHQIYQCMGRMAVGDLQLISSKKWMTARCFQAFFLQVTRILNYMNRLIEFSCGEWYVIDSFLDPRDNTSFSWESRLSLWNVLSFHLCVKHQQNRMVRKAHTEWTQTKQLYWNCPMLENCLSYEDSR